MGPAGLRSPSEAGLRDLRALCLSMAATGSHRVGAGLAYAVTATLVAVATGVPCGSGQYRADRYWSAGTQPGPGIAPAAGACRLVPWRGPTTTTAGGV